MRACDPNPCPDRPLGPAFTYQGQLNKFGIPVEGECTFKFTLWDAQAGPEQIGGESISLPVRVDEGLFVADVDFGEHVLNGQARWLAVALKCGLETVFSPLTPRQRLMPAPSPIRAAEGVGPPNALEVNASTGNVGIGTTLPFYALHVETDTSQYAIYGHNAKTAGIDITGVSGVSESTNGFGVYGWARASSGLGIGVYGRTDSTAGRAVYGWAGVSSGSTYGVFGESASSEGTGVMGVAASLSGGNDGVAGLTYSGDGDAGDGRFVERRGGRTVRWGVCAPVPMLGPWPA